MPLRQSKTLFFADKLPHNLSPERLPISFLWLSSSLLRSSPLWFANTKTPQKSSLYHSTGKNSLKGVLICLTFWPSAYFGKSGWMFKQLPDAHYFRDGSIYRCKRDSVPGLCRYALHEGIKDGSQH